MLIEVEVEVEAPLDPERMHRTPVAGDRLRRVDEAPELREEVHASRRPTDDRACQVKGVVVGTRAASEAERPVVAAQWDGFLGSLEQIGIPRVATKTWVTWPAVAIRVRVNALFNQTPGPGAGAPIA